MKKPLTSAGLCRARCQFCPPAISPALFSDVALNVEMFTGARGPWKTNSCFQMSLQSLPGSSGDEGSSRIRALLKMSGKVGTKSAAF